MYPRGQIAITGMSPFYRPLASPAMLPREIRDLKKRAMKSKHKKTHKKAHKKTHKGAKKSKKAQKTVKTTARKSPFMRLSHLMPKY